MMITREKYLKKILEFRDNTEFIKVLVGMRRTGKSTILKQIVNDLKSNDVDESRIISINFEYLQFEGLKDYIELNKYLESKITSDELHYIFIDEIQNVKSFEKVINSIKAQFNVSIFITGSNSSLLSGELGTLLAGRYREFNIYPYSLNEWCMANEVNSPNNDDLNKYLLFGGLPQISNIDANEYKVDALRDILNSIIYKDIVERTEIKKTATLNRLIEYIILNTSEILSVQSIANTLKSNGVDIKKNTLYDYIHHISNSMITYECKKNIIKGKKVLTKLNKLYVNDLGIWRVMLGPDNLEYSKLTETAVFNHLKYLGYQITYGVIDDLEIDFVVTKFDGEKHIKKYIQVSHKLAGNEKTIEREFKSLSKLDDNFERIIITNDEDDYSRDGIKHIKLLNFLLDEEF